MPDDKNDPCEFCGKMAETICDGCARLICLACLVDDVCPDCADE